MKEVTYDYLDELVDSDPILLRDVAWAEISRLRCWRSAVLTEAAVAEYGALRWAEPLPVPEWVYHMRAAVGAAREDSGGHPGLVARRAELGR